VDGNRSKEKPKSGFALKHARRIDLFTIRSMAIAAVFDPPMILRPLVEIRGEMLIEIAAIGAECFVFIAIAHDRPPHERFTLEKIITLTKASTGGDADSPGCLNPIVA
jgi:hypothetical protein